MGRKKSIPQQRSNRRSGDDRTASGGEEFLGTLALVAADPNNSNNPLYPQRQRAAAEATAHSEKTNVSPPVVSEEKLVSW